MASMMGSIRRAAGFVGREIVDTFYPRTCAGCGMRGMWLCELCEEETLELGLPGECTRCGKPPYQGRCSCTDLDPVIRQARAVAVYDGWVTTAVKRVKYHAEPDRTWQFAEAMAPIVSSLGHVDVLVPVPLHPGKQRKRGYNQSSRIAEHLARMTGIPMLDLLQRTRDTVSQTTLTGRERKSNVADAFVLDPRWHPRSGLSYVLIDDVRTTGATLNACAAALGAASPAQISALTFAVDMQRDELDAYREMVRRVRRGGTAIP
jgi:competence protein ComFC